MNSTQAAIQQTRPFRSRGQRALVALFLAADRVRGRFGDVLEPHDLTVQQYNVLRILRGAEPDGLPTLAIAERMIERAPGITRMIDRLENKGLVTRERRAADRRCVHCRITSKGLGLLRDLDPAADAFDDQAFGTLAERELAQLTRLLEKIHTGLKP